MRKGWCAGDVVKWDLFFFFFTTRTSSSEEDWMRELTLSKFTTSPLTVRIVSPGDVGGGKDKGGVGRKRK